MKKYMSRATKWLAVLTIISAVMLTTGVVLVLVNFPNTDWQIGLITLGGFMSVLFLSCFFAEKSRALVMHEDILVLPKGAEKNGKTVFQKTIIKLNEISSIESKFYQGDRIISGDCFFHTLKLKDGTKVTVTLYAYGKEAEKEILEAIKKRII